MLVVWVFALLSGVVHACGLGAGVAHAAAALSGSIGTGGHESCGEGGAVGLDTLEPAALADAAAAGQADDAPLATHTPCAKFCEDSSAGVPTVKQPFDPRFDVAPAPWALVVVAPLQVAADPAALSARATPPPASVPIPIAFLRLTR